MKSGIVMECVALDTALNENREECIKVNLSGDQLLVVLEDILKLEVCVENPHFKTISFS
jgi:Rho-binding antiterminator